jgi:ACR3 family arsenite efflux pump ArsB
MNLEQRLARIFGHGLSFALIFFLLGLLLRPALWLGIVTLMLVPLSAAFLVWQEPNTSKATRANIALAFVGVALAAVVGFFLRG